MMIGSPLVDAYENDVRLEWTYDDLGRLHAAVEDLAETLESVNAGVAALKEHSRRT